jgi:twitching motility protein PilJ
LRISPASDVETKRNLNELKAIVTRIEKPLDSVVKNLEKVNKAKTAERDIFYSSEPLRTQISLVQSGLATQSEDRKWNFIFVGFFLLSALTAAGLIFRAYLKDTEARADQAEEQKQAAQELEQEAKRMNDQNQSAILRLMNELQEVADGDLTVEATVSEDITGAIADSVNYTVEELRSLVGRINNTAEQVNEASTKAQMISSSLQVASEQQSLEIRNTGESVLRMAQQINEVSARASESVKVARQSLTASEAGTKAVTNAITGMNGIRDNIQETSKRIKRLGESSQEIGEIVELISDITEQTNVLALNAAIQAASAGEATKQIAALIRTIQTDTQDAVSAMERSTQGVVEGTKLSDDAGRALDEISTVSTELSTLIEDFSTTTSKQAASAGTVAQSIQRILLVTEQTSEGTQQAAGSIRQLSELASELKSSVSRFKVQ